MPSGRIGLRVKAHHLYVIFILIVILQQSLLAVRRGVSAATFPAGALFPAVAQTHSLERLESLLVHRTYLFLLDVLLIALHRVRQPEWRI